MASVDECRQALHDLAARLDTNAQTRGRLDFDRTLACRVTDLNVAFHGRLSDGRLLYYPGHIERGSAARAE